jgi:Lipocalin-like domain
MSLFFTQAKSQKLSTNINYDSLIVNTWQTESVKINDKEIELTNIQKNSRVIFYKNHTSENKSNDLIEKGRWSIDSTNMILKVISDILPNESVTFKILSLTSSKFIFSLNNNGEDGYMIFTTVPTKK